MAKVQISITMQEEIKKYLDDLSEKFGINRSAVITMIINQYKDGLDFDKIIEAYEKGKNRKN